MLRILGALGLEFVEVWDWEALRVWFSGVGNVQGWGGGG